MQRWRSATRVVAAAVAVTSLVAAAACSNDDALAKRQAEIADRGAEVMPFDLDATTHVFAKTPDGGVQTVRADDPTDAEQVRLIRTHLNNERDKFARGDFDDPARIHGHDMPGVAELEEGYARIAVTYRERPDGARLAYRTDDPVLVDAIHAWFDRQLMDHGSDAEPG